MVKNLKSLRQQKGISQQTLAEAIGTSQQSINRYENHNIEPDIHTLIALANYFETTVDYLIGRTDAQGNTMRLLDSDLLVSKYRNLDDKEKLCVNTLIDTFYQLKNS